MYTSQFGQDATSDTTTITSTPGVATPGGTSTTAPTTALSPLQAMPASYVVPSSTMFSRYMVSRPGQPYSLNLKPEEIDKAVYKSVPTAAPISADTTATIAATQQVTQLPNGLEIPSYILAREAARRDKLEAQKAYLDSLQPAQFFEVGAFAMQYPAKAAILALIAGMLIGKLL